MSNLLDSPFATIQAIWATPLSGEEEVPPQRLIHQRVLNFPHEVWVGRVGLRLGSGYCKCGSGIMPDWIEDLRVLAWSGTQWQEVLWLRDLPCPSKGEVCWYDLGLSCHSIIFQLRRSGVDGGWSGWNLASSALLVEGDVPEVTFPTPSRLSTRAVNEGRLPQGLTEQQYPGEVRFRSRFLEVGFNLHRPAFTYLALDQEGQGKTQRNLLALKAGWREPLREYLTQGTSLHPLGTTPSAGFFSFQAQGSVRVEGATVTYDVLLDTGQHYELRWSVEADRLNLHAARTGQEAQRVWRSSAWQIAFDASVTQVATLGEVSKEGQAGLMPTPLLIHAPGSGSLRLDVSQGNLLWRSDAARPLLVTTGELKLGELPQPTGEYLLKPGRYEVDLTFSVATPEPLPLAAPPEVRRALGRCTHSAFPFRADTATLANNAISIHVPLCADTWAALCASIPQVGGIPTLPLLRHSLERWLWGAPGYGSGTSTDGGHHMEDEYLMTGVCCLLALGEYLHASGDSGFLEQHQGRVELEWERLLGRDLDGDGLIESPYRTGISGRHEWSTNWYDAISFGWKDAFSNALLYQALGCWRRLPQFVDTTAWRKRLKSNYHATFWNSKTGWLAGWRCREDRLHDYGFLPVNGVAVAVGLIDEEAAIGAVSRLWRELCSRDYDLRQGLPANLFPIPPADCAAPQLGKPYGTFENGGLSFCQAHHFLRGLGAVGLKAERDELLLQLCEGLASENAFGGCGSDLEWKRPDGHPCGYEGLLVDQFGVLPLLNVVEAWSHEAS